MELLALAAVVAGLGSILVATSPRDQARNSSIVGTELAMSFANRRPTSATVKRGRRLTACPLLVSLSYGRS